MSNVDLTKAVRTLFIKSWIDIGKIRLQIAGSSVIVRGRVTKTRTDEPVNGLFIEQLDQQIRAMKGVKNLRWILEDWEHDRGKWKPKEL
jgi:hypothetical protein